jgi:2-keto-4-pentenoate hydratase/2-oxohepta-3-ene-1,7-dioic acid hydratase in catechol pathway/regulator of RNase E activity RraA
MALPAGLVPTKVIGVHVNYPSRAAQRGRVPTHPSYFMKPPSSISDGGEVVRPQGTELLAFEGEIAAIIGTRVRHATPEVGLAAIGWYAPANDLGLHDLRWADRGSNVLSKGHDGYTPIGPTVPATETDRSTLHLITRLNGEVVQDDRASDLIFGFGTLVADLSRFMTLEPGDVILTGTPAGVALCGPGDVVEVELEGVGTVTSMIVEAAEPLASYGAMPKVTDEARAFATGEELAPKRLADDAIAALKRVSTATLTVRLAARGVASTFLTGLRPARPDLRMVGYARTLRYVALREDVRDTVRSTGPDAQKRLVESVEPGDVVVMEARGELQAGTIGDILAARVLVRGGAGIVTDGGVRDSPGVAELDIPSYFRIANATSLWHRHIPLDIDVPITCAGVLVMPGDVLVGDAEGVVVVPRALAADVARDALEVEQREAFALERVKAGEPIAGLYPMSDARRGEFEAWRASRHQEPRK